MLINLGFPSLCLQRDRKDRVDWTLVQQDQFLMISQDKTVSQLKDELDSKGIDYLDMLESHN